MADIKKVISTQLPSLVNPNIMMPPEGDKPVFYSKTGALLLAQAPTFGGITVAICANLAAVQAAVGTADIIAGAYWDSAALNVDASLFRPGIFGWRCDVATANSTYTLPTPTSVVNNLKKTIGGQNIGAGYAWETKIYNTNSHTITFSGASWSFYGGGGASNGIIPAYGSSTMLFLITNITPSSETISIYFY